MVIGALVRVCVCDYPEHVLTWEGYGNRRVCSCVCNYPEHVLTWEGYGNWRVSGSADLTLFGAISTLLVTNY